MNESINNARVFLRLFEKSPFGELCVRSDTFDLFMAREAGRVNPLLAPAGVAAAAEPVSEAVAVPAAVLECLIIRAPHVASLVSVVPAGTAVAVGDMLATLALLDEEIIIAADRAGVVGALHVAPGDLLHYAAPILDLSASA